MSTFNGIVKEIPFIRVDRFNNNDENASIFFISHCHTDHMNGINNNFFDMLKERKIYLYGSPISIRILKNMYPDFSNQLKELSVNESTIINTVYNGNNVYLTVSLIPAGHCPGSVMFIFEMISVRILYTGDFRIDNIEQFVKIFFKNVNKIDKIYLDTTFFKRKYPYFPSRNETLDGICKIIENWLNLSTKHIIHLDYPAHFGSEYLFMEISKKTREKIHVSDIVYNLYKFIPEMDKVVQRGGHQTMRIHAGKCCSWTSFLEYKCTIKVTATVWEDYRIGESVIKCKNINEYRVCASYHPSYVETCEFIKHLKPLKIKACVVPKDEREKSEMSKLLKDVMDQYKETEINENFKITGLSNLASIDFNFEEKLLKSKILSSPPRKFSRKRHLVE